MLLKIEVPTKVDLVDYWWWVQMQWAARVVK